jgi:hypothetical protein
MLVWPVVSWLSWPIKVKHFKFWHYGTLWIRNSMLHPKKTFSEFVCGSWYSSTGDDLKNGFPRSTLGVINWKNWFFIDYRKNGCLISSLADNWDLDDFFFERFICGKWYISRADDISSISADYHPQWLNIISNFNNHPT